MSESPYNVEDLPQIRAGAAQTVITPPLDCYLAGYFHDRLATRVRDDLYCRALVLEGAGGRIALVSLDLVCVVSEWADVARAQIQERTGIGADKVLICATHTHTGPAVRRLRPRWVQEEWLSSLPEMIADTVARASDNMFDALLFPGRQEDDYCTHNRVARRKNGSEVFYRQQDDLIGPAGPIDPELLALGVRDHEGNMRAMVINYATHADVIGGGSADFISADWPGEIPRTIRAAYGDDTVALFLNGPCGDSAPRVWRETRLPQSGPAKAVQLGRALAGLAMNAAEKAEPLESSECVGAMRMLDIPYYTRTEEFTAEIEELRGRDDLAYFEQAIIDRADGWESDGETAHVPVQVLRVGDLVFVGLPGEFFTRWGLEIKHWSPAEYTFVVELANDWFGYVPTTNQAHRGAYGAKPILSRRLDADGGRQMADAVQVMLWELWDGEQ